MTTQPASTPAQILPTEESQVTDLSRFLIEGFQLSEAGRIAQKPVPLRWRYFEPRGNWPGPRSFVVREGEQFTAHVGVVPTAFVSPGQRDFNVTAVYPVDWLSAKQGGMLGTMLMLKAFGCGNVQYSLGSSTGGERILESCGFKKLAVVPLYYRFFKPAKREVWNLIHGQQPFPKNIVMYGVDMARSLSGRLGRPRSSGIALQAVTEFTAEVENLFHSRPQNVLYTSRSAALLNYFLRHPGKNFRGWMLQRDGKNIGFALTNIMERDHLRQGKIVDCFLCEDELEQWIEAISLLTRQLEQADCDLVRTAATSAVLQQAFRANGYFPRGRGGFFLRDTRNLLPKDKPFHLTMIEGDMGY